MSDVLNGFRNFIEGIDGQSMAVSEYGQKYLTFCFIKKCSITAYEYDQKDFLELEGALIGELMKARSRGAVQIIWRQRPHISYDGDGKVKIAARLHFLPQIDIQGLSVKREADLATVLSA